MDARLNLSVSTAGPPSSPAARGHLGAAMTRALAEAGAHVIVNGRDDAKLAAVRRSNCAAEGFRSSAPPSTSPTSRQCAAFFGGRTRLDILVNNAVSMQVKAFAALEPADFAATYASSGHRRLRSGARGAAGAEARGGGGGRCQRHQHRLHVWPGRARRAPL